MKLKEHIQRKFLNNPFKANHITTLSYARGFWGEKQILPKRKWWHLLLFFIPFACYTLTKNKNFKMHGWILFDTEIVYAVRWDKTCITERSDKLAKKD